MCLGVPGNPRSADVEPVRKKPKGVSNVNVGRTEIPENVGHHGYEKHVVHGRRVEGSMPSGLGVENQVNPLWSPECKQKALREAYGPGCENQDLLQLGFSSGVQDASQLGFSAGIQEPLQSESTTTTPQKGYLEMDPVELFRLRCLREAEERFRQGVPSMKSEPKRHLGQQFGLDVFGVDGGKGHGMKNEPSWSLWLNCLSLGLHLVHRHLHLQECLLWDVEIL